MNIGLSSSEVAGKSIGFGHGLRAGSHPQLLVNRVEMRSHCGRAYVERFADVPVIPSLGELFKNFALSWRKCP